MNLVDGQSKEIKTKENSLSTNQSTVILLDKGIDTTCMESCIAINTIYEGIIRLDERKKIIFTNERINELLGFSASELRSKPLKWLFSDIKNKAAHRPVGNILDPKKGKKGVTLETNLRSKNGVPVSVLFSINPVINSGGIKEYIAIVTDIRRLQQAHEKTKNLLHAEKISVLGHLSASIAHEINNPLSYLILDIDRQDGILKKDLNLFKSKLSEKLTEKERSRFSSLLVELQELSDSTKTGLKKIAEIVSAVKSYSRLEDSPLKEEISLEKTLDTALKLVYSKTKNRIIIIREYTFDIPKIRTNGGRLAQVALNMIVNSIQAIPDKGKITVRTFVKNNPKSIGFEIVDTGVGIPENVKNHIFNPYFTTKKDGTGLGLAIAKNIIDELNGTLTCNSEEGKGTTMTVFIPIKK
ncbi:MAG: Sensor protein ZraS [Candidatus Heimdallarchaeota archaeon LC_3]|nr:MAG: Sensor protein ZraS [Candidatus Heimdallarchaeota archaeon LC_3]